MKKIFLFLLFLAMNAMVFAQTATPTFTVTTIPTSEILFYNGESLASQDRSITNYYCCVIGKPSYTLFDSPQAAYSGFDGLYCSLTGTGNIEADFLVSGDGVQGECGSNFYNTTASNSMSLWIKGVTSTISDLEIGWEDENGNTSGDPNPLINNFVGASTQTANIPTSWTHVQIPLDAYNFNASNIIGSGTPTPMDRTALATQDIVDRFGPGVFYLDEMYFQQAGGPPANTIPYDNFESGVSDITYGLNPNYSGSTCTAVLSTANYYSPTHSIAFNFNNGPNSWVGGAGVTDVICYVKVLPCEGTSFNANGATWFSMWANFPIGCSFKVEITEGNTAPADGETYDSIYYTGNGSWYNYQIPLQSFEQNKNDHIGDGIFEVNSIASITIWTYAAYTDNAVASGTAYIDDIAFLLSGTPPTNYPCNSSFSSTATATATATPTSTQTTTATATFTQTQTYTATATPTMTPVACGIVAIDTYNRNAIMPWVADTYQWWNERGGYSGDIEDVQVSPYALNGQTVYGYAQCLTACDAAHMNMFNADGYLQMQVFGTVGGTQHQRLSFRRIDNNNIYIFQSDFEDGAYIFYVAVGGNLTQLLVVNQQPQNGDIMGVRMLGPNYTFYVNNIVVGQMSDSTYLTQTICGFGFENVGEQVSNFSFQAVDLCSPTYTVTVTATQTATPTATPTATQTNTQTNTRTATVTNTASVTLTLTNSKTATPGWTATATPTIPTLTFTNTVTTTNTATITLTSTATPTVTKTATVTQTPTITLTPTAVRCGQAVLDQFLRPDSPTLGYPTFGPLWYCPVVPISIVSHEAMYSGAGVALAIENTFVCNGVVSMTLGSALGVPGLGFRGSDAYNFWEFAAVGNGLGYQLIKYVNGIYYRAASYSLPPAIGDQMQVIFSGPQITCLVNGVTRCATTDSFNQTGAWVGMILQNQGTVSFFQFDAQCSGASGKIPNKNKRGRGIGF